MEEEQDNKTLKEKVDLLYEKDKTKTKRKEFKPFWWLKFKKRSLKQNYILVSFVRNNGETQFKFLPIIDDTIKIVGKDKQPVFYDASADYILRWKKYPYIIVMEWNMKPLIPRENFKEAVEEGTLTSSEKVIYNRMQTEAIKPKSSINIGLILLILAAVGGAVFLLYKMGLIK